MSPPRFLGCPVQTAIADDGTIVLCHEINALLWHAHKANRFACGVEVSGKSDIHIRQIEPLRLLIRYIHDERMSHCPTTMAIMAHAQSHRSRTRDCGAAVWMAGGVWAMDVLGMPLGPVVGSGTTPPWMMPRLF
jgi:hypothetical protein